MMVQSLSGCLRQYPRSCWQPMTRHLHGEGEHCRRIMRRPFPAGHGASHFPPGRTGAMRRGRTWQIEE